MCVRAPSGGPPASLTGSGAWYSSLTESKVRATKKHLHEQCLLINRVGHDGSRRAGLKSVRLTPEQVNGF